ncbi:MAG TPA: beta-ketoacyl-ACP synthase II [Gemmatimonadales bacterium]|nr:beta-ketoacyl-ACP synthase II [Gemmatimonadales bacterium]
MPRRRVVVTGIGLVTPVGNTTEESWSALVAGKSGAARIQRFDPSAFDTQFACEVKAFDALRWMDRKEAKRLDLFCHFAMAATVQAVEGAGLDKGFPDPARTGVLIGSGIGGIATFEEQTKVFLTKGPGRVSPFFVPMFIPDMAAGIVSMRFGLQGPNYCTVSACASSAHAIGESYRLIADGDADCMVTGGAEAAVTPLAMAGFSNMKALSTRNDDPARASRPFDKDRDGFVMGEGAGIVVLESLEHATKRGAPILAEVAGYGMSADAYHMTAPHPEGRGAVAAMKLALADAGVAPERIGYINAHGTSTPLGDAAETAAVKAVFGEHARKLVFGSTKSMTGHLLGAAGGLEFAVCVLAIARGVIPPTINYVTPDPACDLDCAPNTAVKRELEAALSNSFGFGGHNVSIIVKRAA